MKIFIFLGCSYFKCFFNRSSTASEVILVFTFMSEMGLQFLTSLLSNVKTVKTLPFPSKQLTMSTLPKVSVHW